jgi:hypothetical protein
MAEGIDYHVNAWVRDIKVFILVGTFRFYIKLSLKPQVYFHFPLNCKQFNCGVCGVYILLNTQNVYRFPKKISISFLSKKENAYY